MPFFHFCFFFFFFFNDTATTEIYTLSLHDALPISLPIKPGRARTMTHDYKRNGTIDLFAALNVGTGEVLHRTRRRHAAKDVLAFFKWIDLHVPTQLDVHVVLDNLSAHSAPPVTEW